MLEQQRIEYLQAMGIQVWMPRKPVAHAAESLWFAGDEIATSSEEASGVTFKGGHAADLLANMELPTAEKAAVNSSNPKPSNVVNSQPLQASAEQANTAENQAVTNNVSAQSSDKIETAKSSLTQQAAEHDTSNPEESDFVIPEFELHFALWPCGILWVSGQPFDQQDNIFQTSVSYSLLFSSVPQASYSHFKWPYIQGSNEDQSTPVALRALTAQWEFMSSQGARAWVAMDSSSLEWLSKVAAKPLFSVDEKEDLFSSIGKKQLWNALKTLPSITVS